MLRIAGQMAGPIGLKYFVNTQVWRYRLKNFEIFLFHGQRQALQLVVYTYHKLYSGGGGYSLPSLDL